MTDLEYRIGSLLIEGGLIIPHKFIVGACNGVCSLYVARKERHLDVAGYFGIVEIFISSYFKYLNDNLIVGGGECYIDSSQNLVFEGDSMQFGGIPETVASTFGELMKPQLKRRGLVVSNVVVNMNERFLNNFWNSKSDCLGF